MFLLAMAQFLVRDDSTSIDYFYKKMFHKLKFTRGQSKFFDDEFSRNIFDRLIDKSMTKLGNKFLISWWFSLCNYYPPTLSLPSTP